MAGEGVYWSESKGSKSGLRPQENTSSDVPEEVKDKAIEKHPAFQKLLNCIAVNYKTVDQIKVALGVAVKGSNGDGVSVSDIDKFLAYLASHDRLNTMGDGEAKKYKLIPR